MKEEGAYSSHHGSGANLGNPCNPPAADKSVDGFSLPLGCLPSTPMGSSLDPEGSRDEDPEGRDENPRGAG